jgi:hypothetical protein
MARLRVMDGGDALQMWRVVVNVLSKQSRTAENGRSSSLECWERGYQHLNVKRKQLVTNCYTGPRTRTDSLERPRQRKMDMGFGTWNVRSRYRAASLKR